MFARNNKRNQKWQEKENIELIAMELDDRILSWIN